MDPNQNPKGESIHTVSIEGCACSMCLRVRPWIQQCHSGKPDQATTELTELPQPDRMDTPNAAFHPVGQCTICCPYLSSLRCSVSRPNSRMFCTGTPKLTLVFFLGFAQVLIPNNAPAATGNTRIFNGQLITTVRGVETNLPTHEYLHYAPEHRYMLLNPQGMQTPLQYDYGPYAQNGRDPTLPPGAPPPPPPLSIAGSAKPAPGEKILNPLTGEISEVGAAAAAAPPAPPPLSAHQSSAVNIPVRAPPAPPPLPAAVTAIGSHRSGNARAGGSHPSNVIAKHESKPESKAASKQVSKVAPKEAAKAASKGASKGAGTQPASRTTYNTVNYIYHHNPIRVYHLG